MFNTVADVHGILGNPIEYFPNNLSVLEVLQVVQARRRLRNSLLEAG